MIEERRFYLLRNSEVQLHLYAPISVSVATDVTGYQQEEPSCYMIPNLSHWLDFIIIIIIIIMIIIIIIS